MAQRQRSSELLDAMRGGNVEMAAPTAVGEGVVILARDPNADKERPYIRIDPTPPNTGPGDEQNAFPFAYRQGIYAGLFRKEREGSVPLDRNIFRPEAAKVAGVDITTDPYVYPWQLKTIDNSRARPRLGSAPDGKTAKIRREVAHALGGKIGPGDVGRRG